MAVNDDYRIQSGELTDTIAVLKQRNDDMDNLCEQIRTIINGKLLSEGIPGDTANILADTFQEEVIKPALGYSEESEAYIRKNEEVKALAEEASQKTQSIASM